MSETRCRGRPEQHPHQSYENKNIIISEGEIIMLQTKKEGFYHSLRCLSS